MHYRKLFAAMHVHDRKLFAAMHVHDRKLFAAMHVHDRKLFAAILPQLTSPNHLIFRQLAIGDSKILATVR